MKSNHPIRISRLAASSIGAAGLILGVAAPAMASNSASNTHFAVTYVVGSNAGPVTWTCAGEHISTSGQGIVDEEDCALTGPGAAAYVPGVYSGDPNGTSPGLTGAFYNWASDYNGHVAASYEITVNGSSTRAHIESTYAS